MGHARRMICVKAAVVPARLTPTTHSLTVGDTAASSSLAPSPTRLLFTLTGDPIGKPRMTQRDKWKQRPCVMAYRAFADALRLSAGSLKKIRLSGPMAVSVMAYLSIPRSWSQKKRAALTGQPHTGKPDMDNILKAVTDSLFENDECVYRQYGVKFWDDGLGARVEILLEEEP